MKNKILICALLVVGALVLSGCGKNNLGSSDYYQKLAKECEGKPSENCCLSSVKIMEEGHFQLRPSTGVCPLGMQSGGLECLDSFVWCEPENGEMVINEDQFIKRMCAEGAEKYFIDDTSHYSVSLHRCGQLYSIELAEEVDDVPYFIVDGNGQTITSCGGMPGLNPNPQNKECEMACEEDDLCTIGR